MKIIKKIDLLFLKIYSAVLLVIGVSGSITLKSPLFLAIMLFVEVIYLFFTLRRPFKRFNAVKKEFPGEWREFMTGNAIFYRSLDEAGKKHFERDVQLFLSDFSIEGVRRQPVSIEIKLLVASAVAAMLHGKPAWEPPIRDGVVVYPGDRFNRHFQSGKGHFGGMATYNSPLILTMGSLEESLINPRDGNNVVIHELAHYFDMENGNADGIPAARMEGININTWKEIFSREWQKVVNRESFLRDYAGINEAEFFAVANELFFENPAEMKQESPELYEALVAFYNIDTVEILE
ncbi:MAG: zinc-dependent peptidase [bacterium]|nr:zinc-dependent peptidase [bacterium]